MSKEVVIYTRNNCVPCQNTKALLMERGIKYKQRNIDQHDKYKKEVLALGAKGVPVVLVDGEIVAEGHKPKVIKGI